MNKRSESIGLLIRYIFYHFKSIEARLEGSRAIDGFIQQDKQRINMAITKVASGINQLLSVVRDQDLIRRMKADADKPDLAYYMVLTEQLFDLKEDDLMEITDMIDEYLQKKYNIGTEPTGGEVKAAA
jgi:hypothetical protein